MASVCAFLCASSVKPLLKLRDAVGVPSAAIPQPLHGLIAGRHFPVQLAQLILLGLQFLLGLLEAALGPQIILEGVADLLDLAGVVGRVRLNGVELRCGGLVQPLLLLEVLVLQANLVLPGVGLLLQGGLLQLLQVGQ
jgi:hypothetical protein